ncbi:MAG TPA: hypothetical protein VHO95_06460 [Candidatus Dormibacteraeota bacterium]|nr:hypothetical protein [Candidatus Dormibacteraeota bacterium]
MFLRRLLLVFSIVLCGLLALAAAGNAAGFLGPGKYTFHSTSADAFFGMGKKGGPPSPSFMVSVSQGLNSFKPTDPPGDRIVIDNTMVFVSEFDGKGSGGFGCFIVPDNNFVVGSDLQSASLHTILTADEACPGFGTPVGGKGGGFPGGNGGLVLPMQVDVTWTATSAVTTYKQTFNLQCLDFNEDGNSTNMSTGAAATGSISALGTQQFSSESAGVNATDGMLDVRGELAPPCGG